MEHIGVAAQPSEFRALSQESQELSIKYPSNYKEVSQRVFNLSSLSLWSFPIKVARVALSIFERAFKSVALLNQPHTVNSENQDTLLNVVRLDQNPLSSFQNMESLKPAEILTMGACLEAQGGSLDTLVDRNGNMAEFKAAKSNRQVDVNQKDAFGNSLLHMASFTGNKGILSLLLDKGGQVNIRDNKGRSPLLLAAQIAKSV